MVSTMKTGKILVAKNPIIDSDFPDPDIFSKFQFFEPYSHIIPSNLKAKLEVGKYYEFTYTIQGKGYIEDFDDVIKNINPENVQLEDQNRIKVNLSIKETDKIGLDQLQEPICQK